MNHLNDNVSLDSRIKSVIPDLPLIER
jgi:hypothetical protein